MSGDADLEKRYEEMRREAICIGCGETYVTFSADDQKCIWCSAKEEMDPRATAQEGVSE